MQDNINKILFISLSNIGDAILTTPVLEALHERYPQAVIDIVGDERSSEVFKYCPFRGELFHKNKKFFLRGMPVLIKTLWRHSYDLVVDLRTDGLAYLIPARKRLTKLNRKALATHSVNQHMAVISDIYTKPPPACRVWLSDTETMFAKKVLGDYYGKKLLGLGLGANTDIKIWPRENYLSLINKTAGDYDAVVLLGDSRDKVRSDFIASQASVPCISLCGKTSILQAAAVQSHVYIFVGNDSGLSHLASAAGTSTLTIFGSGEPDRYRPWGEKSSWLVGARQDITAVTVDDVVKLMREQEQEQEPASNLAK